MITITKKGILIKIDGLHGADTIDSLNKELIDVLQIASSSKYKGYNYYWLFLLLQSISPTFEQFQQLYPHHSNQLKKKFKASKVR